jgi:hypothetical protein
MDITCPDHPETPVVPDGKPLIMADSSAQFYKCTARDDYGLVCGKVQMVLTDDGLDSESGV